MAVLVYQRVFVLDIVLICLIYVIICPRCEPWCWNIYL